MINQEITKYKWPIGHVAHLRNYISKWLYNNVDLEKKNLRELNGPLFEQTWISFTQGSFLKSYMSVEIDHDPGVHFSKRHRIWRKLVGFTKIRHFFPVYILMEWCVAPSSGGSSFLSCFGAVHYSLQSCADWGDQVPARNHLALHSIYWSSICLPFFSTTTKMLSLSLCTDTLSTSSCLLDHVIPIALSAFHIDCPTKPLHPTSTAKSQIFHPFCWQSFTSSW